ncbi:MAG: ribonuclease Y [Lentisphaeria bacterium]|nr:ribonuclease Y [Lentisphaeria bacterium]MBR3708015.1 ribonuclease Y [Lentisphaeria bacterium]MBR4076038.1 ribonuclease Y [Lentisphaeria bacterium]
MDTTSILVSAAAGLGGLIIGAIVCALINKAQGRSASAAAAKIRKEAELAAETLKREANITAREDARRIKDEIESELKERRKEVSQAEKRIQQKEDNLDRKSNSLDSKLKNLERKEGELEEHRQRLIKKEDELKATIAQQIDELQRIAELDRETAKNMILEKLKGEVENECGLMVRDALDDAKRRIERESQELMVNAIQRYSGDCTYERTTATIPLPNDEMKGRIIGREGRNIRALEAATGVNILIDDTPEAVVISCFDPIRKEIARRLMEKLISDGRIHPTRIEELIKKISREIDEEVFSVGERAVLDCGLHGVPKALINLLGRLQFRFSFSQNVLKHSIETAAFMGAMAAELKLDEQKARRIGLFHDIGKAVDHEVEGTHAAIGADLLRKYNENKDVINAVAAHHCEVEATSIYGILVNACDALSASRPGARSETTELYLKRLEQLETIAKEFPGVDSCFALQAGREVRVVVQPEKVSEAQANLMARDICLRIEKEMNYPGQIKVSIIRETRAVEYAK